METPQIKAPEIKDWHAHVYFDAATRDAAWALRERIEKEFDIDIPDEEAEKLRTVGDAMKYLHDKMGK